MRDEDYKEGTPLKRLPVKRTIDFLKSRLPLGMGSAKSRNLLYMFGGNHPSERDKLGSEPDIYRHNLEEDPPCLAFMLDLVDDTSKPTTPLLRNDESCHNRFPLSATPGCFSGHCSPYRGTSFQV